jgi:hypothetical protein
MYRKYIR